MKRNKIVFSSAVLVIVLLLCFLTGFIINDSFKPDLTINNGQIESSELLSKPFTSKYISKASFNDMPVSNVDGVTFNILSNKNIKDIPVLLKSQRYYIPVSYISKILGYTVENNKKFIALKNSSVKIKLYDSKFTVSHKTKELRGNIIYQNDDAYISISDIEEIFHLIAVFNFENKEISLLNYDDTQNQALDESEYTKTALLRLEDFTSGGSYSSDKNQTKVKCVANLLYSNGVNFHVAWIPRYINPPENIDNDLLETESIQNVGFINLLDYLINHNALIGLHGYSHQSGDTVTGLGVEISDTVNSSLALEKQLIEKSIDTSKALNINYGFFETPHYTTNKNEKKIIEEYFQYIYEPFDGANNTQLYRDRNNLFIPTPLSCVVDKDTSKITSGLSSSNTNILNSCYYHTYIEFEYINFSINNNKFTTNYDTNSPLHQIINSLQENKCKTLHINQLNKYTTS